MDDPVATAGDGAGTTLARQLCRRVLSTAKTVDDTARITSVSRWDRDNATLLRISTNSGTPLSLTDMLRKVFPLAKVALVENVVEGTTEAQILVPSNEEQRDIARSLAEEAPAAQRVRTLARGLGLAALMAFCTLVTANALTR